jgi:anti-anti-sigma factor
MTAPAPMPRLEPRMLEIPYSNLYRRYALAIDNRQAFKRAVLDHVHDGERDFVLDLRPADYIDASGLGVLVSLSKQIRAVDGTFVLLAPNPDLETLFQLTSLDRVLTIRSIEEWIRLGGAL